MEAGVGSGESGKWRREILVISFDLRFLAVFRRKKEKDQSTIFFNPTTC